MPIPEEEISRRYEEIFGKPIDPEKRSGFAALLNSLDRTNLRVINALAMESEPMGHRAILRGMRDGR